MSNSNKKKADQLGMPIGTAANRLKKSIMFMLLKRLNENYCFKCGSEIENEDELSIEHKIPYLDSENPMELYFDLNNISFSHLTCNVGSARQTKTVRHPSQYTYMKGCRCEECKEVHRESNARWRSKKT